MTFRARAWNNFGAWLGGKSWFHRYGSPVLTAVDRTLVARTGRSVTAPFRGGLPVMNLTSTGARSGEPRTVPLLYLNDGGAVYVVGSNWGKEHHPAWTANLLANPRAEMTSPEFSGPVTAELVDDGAAEMLWPKWIELYANYQQYRESTARNIRMFRLRPDA